MSGEPTPGPWFYKPHDNCHGERLADQIVTADGNIIVLDVFKEDNAYLIAAAPELRSAVEDFLIHLSMGWELDGPIKAAELALAKADGREAAAAARNTGAQS